MLLAIFICKGDLDPRASPMIKVYESVGFPIKETGIDMIKMVYGTMLAICVKTSFF